MVHEIWFEDFEFNTSEGNVPHPVCFCATELGSRKSIKLWLDGVNIPPQPIDFKDPTIIHVAYFAVAEMACHLVLGWDIPENIIDLFCEWRVLTNSGLKQPNSLLNVCQHFGIPTVDPAYKNKMRERILKGAPFDETEIQEILEYCNTDVVETMDLYNAMSPVIDNMNRALFRGKYMAITAKMEHRGVPLDVETLTLMRDNWELLKLELIKKVKEEFDFFDGLTFKTQAFADYLYKNNMAWLFTDKGNLKMDDETWKDMVLTYPFLQPVREVRALLGKFKKLNVTCGSDGRNRGMLSPFSTKTGRNAPKVQCIFTNPSWLRCLIKPREGTAIAYLDYEQQEFDIAAILSGDINMQRTYDSGDPYLQLAKMAGAIPPDGTKKTHKEIRDLYKQSCLAIQYGMGARSLSVRVNRPLAYASELIRQHQRLFPKYWTWQDDVITQSKLNKRVQTLFGWQMRVLQGTCKEDLTLGNFLMQATGADILKVSSYLLDLAGIKIIAPVHDALLIEVDLETADQDILQAEKIMQEGSKIVLGKPLRTEVIIVKYPDRYIDVKGKATWEKVRQIIQGIHEGTIAADIGSLDSMWAKHSDKLQRMKDSPLSSNEKCKNPKGLGGNTYDLI